MRLMGLEPIRLPTRPSNVRVCQFRHSRIFTLSASDSVIYYTHYLRFVNTFFRKDRIFYGFAQPSAAPASVSLRLSAERGKSKSTLSARFSTLSSTVIAYAWITQMNTPSMARGIHTTMNG